MLRPPLGLLRRMASNLSASSSPRLSTRSMQSSLSSSTTPSFKSLPSPNPTANADKSHHVKQGDASAGFTNPWPSYKPLNRMGVFKTRFGKHPEKNFVAVPPDVGGVRSSELVRVRKPDWGKGRQDVSNVEERLRTTWLGHASYLVEFPVSGVSVVSDAANMAAPEVASISNVPPLSKSIRVIFDPVWSERTSPFTFIGPKRYSPVPCPIGDLPDVDIICISHNHYDHLDFVTMQQLFARRKDSVVFCVPLGDRQWFIEEIGVSEDKVVEFDWWDRRSIIVPGKGELEITCTPAQHGSGRSIWDQNRSLWCGYVLVQPTQDSASSTRGKQVYFAGDTAYQAVGTPSPCPAFAQIAETFTSFDLAMLPIGLCTPASFMGSVHATPEQSLEIHKTVKAHVSLGMHYGTVRGGISAHYEDVRDPPRRWRVVAEKNGLWSGGGVEGDGSSVDVTQSGVGLCDIGETVVL